jgi:hypothetical protein
MRLWTPANEAPTLSSFIRIRTSSKAGPGIGRTWSYAYLLVIRILSRKCVELELRSRSEEPDADGGTKPQYNCRSNSLQACEEAADRSAAYQVDALAARECIYRWQRRAAIGADTVSLRHAIRAAALTARAGGASRVSGGRARLATSSGSTNRSAS